MALLELAAQAADETVFVQIAQEINWHARSASEFARAVRLALNAGAHLAARGLSQLGARLHPGCAELEKAELILGPPTITRSSAKVAESSLEANRQWLLANGAAYRDCWIALRDGKLLASAQSAQELRARIGDLSGVLVTKGG